eukprot:s741_g3.t1
MLIPASVATKETSGWKDLELHVFGDERLNFGRYKEGLMPNEQWAFATCVKGSALLGQSGTAGARAPTRTETVEEKSPSGVLANLRARRLGLPLPFAAAAPLRADVGWPWRMDWGGHDPASPVAEMHINYHNTGWGIMIFVCTSDRRPRQSELCGLHCETMADEKRSPSALQMQLARQSPSGLLANIRARRLGLPLPFAAMAPMRADVGWPWRMDWGGHDPASPVAEMHINYHNTGWGIMIFVCTSVRQRGEKGGMNRQQRQEDRQDKRDGRAGRRQNDRSRNMHEGKKEPEEGPGRRRQRRRERKAGPPDGQAQTEAEEKEALAKQSTTPGHAARDSESPERDCGGPSSVGSRIEGSRTEDSDSKLS